MQVNHLIKNDRGSTITIIAIMSTVFMAIAALVVDYGLLSVQKHRLENSVDAAALAGAQELPNYDAAIAKAKEYAEKNGLNLEDSTIEVSSDLKTVGVSTYKIQPLNFARVFNKNKSEIKSRSKAELTPVNKIWGAVPLGIDDRVLTYGQYVSLKVAPDNDTDYLLGSGNYGVLALSGAGASNYENDLKFGFQSSLSIGNVIPLQTGNISGATNTAINYRINQCPHNPKCSIDHFERDCSMIIKVPVYQINSMNGSNQVKDIKIIGFAAFLLDSYAHVGKDNYVNGYFVRTLDSGEYSDTAPDYGLKVVHLTNW